ncbi:MAG: type II CAAX prenyl endopeptidase Rce1 family protein [Promethearchaeota archaeon]
MENGEDHNNSRIEDAKRSFPSNQTIKCPTCHSEWPTPIRFCGTCGNPFPEEWFCSQCGISNNPYHHFCINCGTPRLPSISTSQQSYSVHSHPYFTHAPERPYFRPSPRPTKIKCQTCGTEEIISHWRQKFRDYGHCPKCNRPLLPQSFSLIIGDLFLSIIILIGISILGSIIVYTVLEFILLENRSDLRDFGYLVTLALSELSLIVIPYLRTKNHFSQILGLQWTSQSLVELIIGSITGLIAAFGIHYLIAPFFGEDSQQNLSTVLIVLIAGLQIFVAISEEILFRGYFQNALQMRFTQLQAFALSVAVFAVVHVAISNVIAGLLVGSVLGFGYIYFEGRNYFGIGCHFIYNVTIFLFTLT